MLGQRLLPDNYHQIVASLSETELSRYLHGIRHTINQVVERLPPHRDFIQRYCKADGN